MKCTQARRLMAMALAGDTDERQHADLDRHLAGCADCARQWHDLSQNAATVEQARPAANETSADLVAAAMERIRPRSRVREVRVRWAARAAAVALMVAAALWMTTRPPDKLALLARVEAALAVEPSYTALRVYDASGEQVYASEQWHLADGDVYTENELKGQRRTASFHRRASCTALQTEENGGYALRWEGDAPIELREHVQNAKQGAKDAGLPSAAGRFVGFVMGAALADGHELVEARESWGELEGNRTRVITLRTESRLPVGQPTHQAHDIEATIHLEPAGDRLLRVTMSFTRPDGSNTQTADIYPIFYGVEPPASIITTIPEGTMVAMHGGTYHNDMVDPVWEHMSEAERERLTEVVRDTIGGWARGDFDAFAEHYDFAGITDYGVKGKFTPEKMAEHWRHDVERRRGRYQTCEVRVDYAVATAKPPGSVASRWSIERTGLPAGEGWITFRDEPTEEPGITVFAWMTVTQTDGETRDAATLLFLKEVEGDYRVIGWDPPF